MDGSFRPKALNMAVPAAVFAGLLYMLRAANQTPDGLSYASSVRSGLEMFHPHHLIYVPVARLIHLATGADPVTAALWQNLVWTIVLGLAAWRLAGLVFASHRVRVLAALALLATRGAMIYTVRVETYLPALACLAVATALAAERPYRPWLLGPLVALAVLYHQTNVLFVIPVAVLMVGRARGPDTRRAAATLTGAAVLVLAAYLAGFWWDKPDGGFWAFTMSYARAPVEAWGNFAYYSAQGVLSLAVSQIRMILPVREVAAVPGGLGMLAILTFLVVWHLRRLRLLRSKVPLCRLRVFSLVFLIVYLLFFLWWMPADHDFFLATLLPLWLLGLILISDLPPLFRSQPTALAIALAMVLALAVGNIFFTIVPMHRDPGPGRELALALDRSSPAGVEFVTGYAVQQEMLYFTGRTRVHEGEGLARAVLAGEAPWSGTSQVAPVIVVGGPWVRDLLSKDDPATGDFLAWLVGFAPEDTSCLAVRRLPQGDGLLLGPDRRPFTSWQELAGEIRELAQP